MEESENKMLYKGNEKMNKKFFAIILVLMTTLALFKTRLNANSAPIHDPGTTSHLMLIDESSEIEITSENLKFDFMNLQGLEMKDGGREMTVTATYTMQNSGDAQKVKMAFPLLGYLDYDYQKYSDVLVDGAEVDYDFYFSESRYNAYAYNSGYAYLSSVVLMCFSPVFVANISVWQRISVYEKRVKRCSKD
jgi:hypothetical protein